jgi:hypothetical protein
MAGFAKYEALVAAAKKLSEQAQNDPKIAANLIADPGKAIAEAAGQPLPQGVVVKMVKDTQGKDWFVPQMDPQYNGELDNELLEAVSGGKGGFMNINFAPGTTINLPAIPAPTTHGSSTRPSGDGGDATVASMA